MIDLSIVIPCYIKNEELLQLTKNTIHSFRQADLPEYELILIDDGIGTGYLRQEADTYIYHKENKGFVHSINDGIRVARGKYIALANNDIRVAPNFYNVASEIFKSNGRVYSVHPRMLFYDDEMDYGDTVKYTGMERWCQSSFFIINTTRHKATFPEEYEGTGGAYEDWCYWARVRREGFYTAYTTKTCFQHKDSSTTQLVGEGSKQHETNKKLFREEFGHYPEEYFLKNYPKQMGKDWRKEFTKI